MCFIHTYLVPWGSSTLRTCTSKMRVLESACVAARRELQNHRRIHQGSTAQTYCFYSAGLHQSPCSHRLICIETDLSFSLSLCLSSQVISIFSQFHSPIQGNEHIFWPYVNSLKRFAYKFCLVFIYIYNCFHVYINNS